MSELESKYDVVIVGTGLVESILAAALSRAKKSVLHIDGNDYYGGLDAVWTLDFLKKQASSKQQSRGTTFLHDAGECGTLEIHGMETVSSWDVKVDCVVRTPYGRGVVKEMASDGDYTCITINLTGWKLADGSYPTLCLRVPASQRSPEYLYETHGVRAWQAEAAYQVLEKLSRYIVLDLTPQCLFANSDSVKGLVTSSVADYLEFKPIENISFGKSLDPVPCSKSDVFASKSLSGMDKRRLMKFLQSIFDLAVNDAAEDVQSINELQLKQGRSLSRPQNKSVGGLDEFMKDADADFESFLQSKLSPALVPLVRYAMALETTAVTTRQGIERLCEHVSSLGVFGTTGLILNLYGSGEYSQAFCRSAAVYGATYLLRKTVKEVDAEHKAVTIDDDTTIAYEHLVLPDTAIVSNTPRRRVMRRISILAGKLFDQSRHVLILPPNTIPNQPHVIQGLLLDETVSVVPHNVDGGCSMLHLTAESSDDESILARAASTILADRDVHEIFHVDFSYGISNDDSNNNTPYLTTKRGHPNLTADATFRQAEKMFQQICGDDAAFLQLCEQLTQEIEERFGENAFQQEDEEQEILEKAVSMIDGAANKAVDANDT